MTTALRFGTIPVSARTGVLIAVLGCGARADSTPPPFRAELIAESLDRTALESAIDGLGGYIVRHTLTSGRFTYVIDADGKPKGKRYNVLRHGGTIYALAELRGFRSQAGDDVEVVDAAIARSSAYLVEKHLGTFEPPAGSGSTGSIAVWSLLGEEIRSDTREAKLGGAGLGLVALCAAHKIAPEQVAIDALRGLGLTIASMQRDDGHFVSKWIEGKGPAKEFVSLYYPGESILGLARLYEIDRDRRWIDIAGKAIAALATLRADLDDSELPADHWLLIGIAEIVKLSSTDPSIARGLPISAQAMTAHAIRIADAMLVEQRRAGAAGSFHPEGRSTPTATRLEGILALLSVLPQGHEARARLAAGARAGIAFLMRCQVGEEVAARAGGMPRRCPDGGPGRQSEIRIDYAQHALSAMIGAHVLGL